MGVKQSVNVTLCVGHNRSSVHKKNEEVELPQTWGSTSVQPKVGTDRFLVSKEFNLSDHSVAISVRAY